MCHTIAPPSRRKGGAALWQTCNGSGMGVYAPPLAPLAPPAPHHVQAQGLQRKLHRWESQSKLGLSQRKNRGRYEKHSG